jgi:hypothetical protein
MRCDRSLRDDHGRHPGEQHVAAATALAVKAPLAVHVAASSGSCGSAHARSVASGEDASGKGLPLLRLLLKLQTDCKRTPPNWPDSAGLANTAHRRDRLSRAILRTGRHRATWGRAFQVKEDAPPVTA